MFIMDYTYIREEDFPYYAKHSTGGLLHTYIDAHSQIFMHEYPGYVAQYISRLKSHCASMNLSDQSKYDGMFQSVMHKGGSVINYIKQFQNSKALVILLENSYSEDQLMHTFLDDLHKGEKQSAQIVSHQEELRKEETFVDKKSFSIFALKNIT